MSEYDDFIRGLESLEIPDSEQAREVVWSDEQEALGVSRHPTGGYEIFLRGDRLRTTLPRVGRHLRYDRWERRGGDQFAANRLVLPAADHFLAIAAFLATELVRAGALSSPQSAFTRTEPTIDLALAGAGLADEFFLGLVGELLFLETCLCAAADAQERARTLEAWKGFQRSTRDFEFPNGVAIEVKVTSGTSSRHQVSGVGQVDPRRAPDGSPTEQLYLASFGVVPGQPGAGGRRLPDILDALLLQLGDSLEKGKRNAIQELLLLRVRQYGVRSGTGYHHDEMASWGQYQTPWSVGFSRAYDMCDVRLSVLRYASLEPYTVVLPESVTFTVDLPDSIGAGNPLSDFASLIVACVRGEPVDVGGPSAAPN